MSSITLTIDGSELGENGLLTLEHSLNGYFALQMELYKKLEDDSIESSYCNIELNPAELPHVLHMLQAMANLIQYHIAYVDE